MTKVIGVRFRNAGKMYYFDPGEAEPARGSRVVVETSRGVECGRVVLPPTEVEDDQVVQPLCSIMRVATEEDLNHEKENRDKEKEAFRICKDMIRSHNLDMKLVRAEYTFDNKKVLFYFTADGRVDFRELVKDLASIFKMRIELRQIGVRDETKMLGGLGICGRPLCCSSYLTDFAPVSIKMAKEQNLSLNPSKISGVCGRLMCCLKNEEETYEYLNKSLPGVSDIMETPEGKEGMVQAVNVLKQTVRILIEEGDNKEIEEHPASEMTLLAKRKKGGVYQQVAASRKEKSAEEDPTEGTPSDKTEREQPRTQRPLEQRRRSGEHTEGNRRRDRGDRRRDRDSAQTGGKPEGRRDRRERPADPRRQSSPEAREVLAEEETVSVSVEESLTEQGGSGEKRHRRRRRRRSGGHENIRENTGDDNQA